MEFEVIEIHPDCKYMLRVTEPVSHEVIESIRAVLDEWLESDKPIVIVSSKLELVKVLEE